ncbi:MAG: uroporphyrinogen-III C-methyltransferase [Capsulimonas sp.]|uniref:uroporphyrinogen-III C-methyltransferase n=1 Tax=Capsulimonas sp. TaxID=2494211 RepID=UPI00326371DA
MSTGIVTLIGAGPGDPNLITVGGAAALAAADVVVYDRLAHPSLLRHAPRAEKIYVGKKADQHAMKQDEINALLAERALAGQNVARLKGGDPFVFGRGGEEAEYVRERGIEFVIIPGVTSAIAAPAYAGIPVTHRDAASSFAVITGHERDDARESGGRAAGQAEGRRRWDKIANAGDTLLFLMGVENLEEITTQLMAHGRGADTPVALVRWGTWAGQQATLTSTLGEVVERVRAAGFKAPAVTIVGEVVNLRERLRWFDRGALAGKRVIVTRAREQASGFVEMLRARYAEPIEFPLIRITSPGDNYASLDTAIGHLNTYRWVLFTSAPAVSHFFARLFAAGKDTRALSSVKVGAVGPATAAALKEFGVVADFRPEAATGAALAEELPGEIAGARILIPRAQEGEAALLQILTDRWAKPDEAAAYENVVDGEGAEEVRQRLAEGSVDIVTFTSSSTVKNFVSALEGTPLPASVQIACIGPSTAATATELLGRAPDILAKEHTLGGLIAAMEEWA